MKNFVCIILLTVLSQNIMAQRFSVPLNLPNYDNKTVHFGFLIGINALDFKLTPKTQIDQQLYVIKSQNQKGFNLGVVSNFRLSRSMDLRAIPTLSLAERRIQYTLNENFILTDINKKIESTFIEFPLSIKYKSNRYNNLRSYVITGLKYSLDLASQRNIDDEGLELVKIQQNDLSYEIGIGFDFYLPFFKFSPEFKANFGIINMLVNDGSIYSNSLKDMKTRGFTISFTFE
jgi:hypothetical protein